MKILFVDDSEVVLGSVVRFMESFHPDFDIFTAFNGQHAIEMLEQENFDIIVLDYRMPIMNGLETALYIRAKYPDIKLIAHTSEVSKFVISSFLDTVDGYLIKPSMEFSECFDKVISGQKYICEDLQKEIDDKEKYKLRQQSMESQNWMELKENEKVKDHRKSNYLKKLLIKSKRLFLEWKP